MANQKLNNSTVNKIKELQKELQEMLEMESNMEVVWKLEKLHSDKTLIKSATYIRSSID